MEGEVIELNSKRKKRAEIPAEYYCLRCETEHFKLYLDGSVVCVRCGSRMRNLGIFRLPDAS